MDSTNPDPELAKDFSPLIKIYKDGRVERLISTETVPLSFDPETNVECKDTLYSPEHNLCVRLYLPKNTHQNQKLPILVYFRGGGFCVGTVFAPINHNYLNILVSEANIIAVSVDYRNAPEHPLPAAFNDSWSALKWVASHFNQKGPEDWLNCYADFQRVFFSGDSAGGNIAHQMAIKHGHEEKLEGLNLTGLILCHPFFWGEKPIPGESKEEWQRNWIEGLWKVVNPTTGGLDDDPWINPAYNPNLDRLGCERVQVFVSEKDPLRERGWFYCLKLRESGWRGDMEVIDYKGEEHVFHLENLTSQNSVSLRRKIVQFINR
ncbi:hypothetical protein Ddye_003695 [Dipteronia dyeriana]|uniref:Alpha/beta hydrolase fold-3 domain-containing protein n=1 Tax=Dipteronia dyeriana TaxID=168575 RepID=A0AAD9XTC9_9ROSI|nr:hypothetical protein Ddye_003695 [Dipteronia dyeriana]